MGSFPHELPGYRHVSDDDVRGDLRAGVGRGAGRRAGAAHPQHAGRARSRARFKGIYIQGEDIAQSDPDTQPRHRRPGGDGMRRGAGPVPERDGELRACLPAGGHVPGEGRHLHQRRAPDQPRAQGDAAASGLADWEVDAAARPTRWAMPMHYTHPSEIMDEIARTTPTFAGVSYAKLDALGSVQWPCNDAAPEGTPMMHIGRLRARQGQLHRHRVRADRRERTGPRFPLLLTTGRILSQYNVGAQTRRTANVVWHARGRAGDPSARRRSSAASATATGSRWPAAPARPRCARTSPNGWQPGVVYTTFHHPDTQANVVTTEYSDWATNCPEYKVTAVQVVAVERPERVAARLRGSMSQRSRRDRCLPCRTPRIDPARPRLPRPAHRLRNRGRRRTANGWWRRRRRSR